MSSSIGASSTSVVQEESPSMNLLIPLGAGITAPPPTPMASMPPPHPSAPLTSKPADVVDQTFLPCQSTNISSPPSKEDLDALAHYLMQQSLHSTPNLLASPTLQRKRRSLTHLAAAIIQPDNEILGSTSVEEVVVKVVNGRNDMRIGEVMQTYSYSGGFCEESRKGIGKTCQEVGAFYISVQDADAALMMLRGGHGADDESIVQGGLVPLSQLLNSNPPQHHQDDVLDLDPLAFDASVDTNFRDTMTRFAKLLFGISKDLLGFLLQDLSIETQANIRGHSLKPLLYIHEKGKQELNLDDDVVLLITHDIDSHEDNKSALFLATMGTQLQTWSQGKYKTPIFKSLCNNGSGEVCIQFALIHHS